MNWDAYFLDLCRGVSKKSKDRSTRVGCILTGPGHEILSTGYNGFPRGVDDERPEWHERPLKYRVTQHAETNAITNAARCGTRLQGCTVYVPWHPCAACAGAIINVGAAGVVLDGAYVDYSGAVSRWQEDLAIAGDLFASAGVAVRYSRPWKVE